MDDLLSLFARLLGRMLGKASYCGFDCPVSEFGWPEYAILGLVFLGAFLGARAVMRRIV
jgi:hypothetical protein